MIRCKNCEKEEAIDKSGNIKIDKRHNELIVISLLIITVIALGIGFYIKNRMVLRQVLAVTAYNEKIAAGDDSSTGKELGYSIRTAGEYVYYVTNPGKLVRTKIDGSDSETILEEDNFILDYAIYGRYIYYLIEGTRRQLFRVKLDGTDKINLGRDVLYFIINKDKIYYTSSDDIYYGCRLNSIDLQDNKTSFINYIDGVEFCIKDEVAYFKEIDRQESYIFFKEVDGQFSNRNRQNRYRYLNAANAQGNIYKMPLNGSDKVKLTDAVVTSFFITDNHLFYSKLNDGGAIYKCDLNGNNETKIYDGAVAMMTLADGWIYIVNYNQDNIKSSHETVTTRISLDGKKVQTLN